ncbi:TIM protein, partial [Corythaixoides concolor]|nr:TIM protein [Corythaixoides concolor]
MEEHWVPEEGAGQGLAHRLHQEGLAGPLRWLRNCLRRTAGDREEDGERAGGCGWGWGGGRGRADGAGGPGVAHPVPLVPLSEENEDAMEDRRFRALLRQLGLRPPASEQESFWRIPATLTPQQLRRAAASIAHHGPDPPGCPQDPLEPPGCPQDPIPGEGLGWGSEEPGPVPVPSPVPSGPKRRRELNSEDEDGGSSGGLSPSGASWGALGVTRCCWVT